MHETYASMYNIQYVQYAVNVFPKYPGAEYLLTQACDGATSLSCALLHLWIVVVFCYFILVTRSNALLYNISNMSGQK